MKTFNDDKPILRYSLIIFGVIIGSFFGTISATILLGVILK